MGSPKQPELAVDPNLQAEQAAANKTLVDQLQIEAQGDTATMMARYGTRLALSAATPSTPSPMSAAA